MLDNANGPVIYEQPLNERVRSFLRLEHLFQRVEHELQYSDTWAHRTTLEALNGLMTLLGRADLKAELLNELKRHTAILEALENNPQVNVGRLHQILGQGRALLEQLRASDGAPGSELRDNDLLNNIKNRASIPAGTCGFDLPGFYYWQQQPADQRLADLRRWVSYFDPVKEAVFLCLTMIRESATATREKASTGFFQKSLPKDAPYQMLRVGLPVDAPWYPEVSAGRHRFTIRFMQPSSIETRPVQTEAAVEFDLLCCVL